MAPLVILSLLLLFILPVAWLASEFGHRRPLRIGLGLAAIVSAIGVAYVVGQLSRLNYNAWYGSASKNLIDTTIVQIEDGNLVRVMSVLRRVNLDYSPTYENRANYDEMVKEAVSQMKGDHTLQNTKWETSPFTRDSWIGHWENDSGYWIVIHSSLDIVRSGENMPKMTKVVLSDDCKSMTFTEGGQWRHELTLKNKYEATQVWRDLKNGNVWKTYTLHKLRRATPEQRTFTQQK